MRHLVTSLSLLILSGSATTQLICERANENTAPSIPSPATSWFALKLNAQNATVIGGAEFFLLSTGPTQTMVGFYDEDTSTGKPRNLVQSAPVQLQSNVPSWNGAAFPTPIPVFPNTNYFIAVQLGSGISPGMDPAGRFVTHYWSPPAWSGPFNTQRWMYRVYCGVNSGAFSTYGTGKAGTGSFVPAMVGIGFPNIGNPITLQLHSSLNGSTALLLWGRQANQPTTIGTVYSFPILFTSANVTLGLAPGAGYLNTDLDVPMDRSLAGVQAAFQSWILDAGAAQGISNSNGLLMKIGT